MQTILIKRNGKNVNYNKNKIKNVIQKALTNTNNHDPLLAENLTNIIHTKLKHGEKYTTDQIHDIVEKTLMSENYPNTAKAYILYRNSKEELYEQKKEVLNAEYLDDPSKTFSLNSLRVLSSRYLFRDDNNKIIETPDQLFDRVAILIGIADVLYDKTLYSKTTIDKYKITKTEIDNIQLEDDISIGKYTLNQWHINALKRQYYTLQKHMKKSFINTIKDISEKKLDSYEKTITTYKNLMTSQKFLPNSPTLMNAGGPLGQLSACFVLGIDDSLDDIMKTAGDVAKIFQSGGGVGINYSSLREKDSMVKSTSGIASGPISFMNIIDTVTNVVKQGGKRRGANMGILNITHPDIEEFIDVKNTKGLLENFNISVGITKDFMDALEKKKDYELKSIVNKEKQKTVNSEDIMNRIATSAWQSAEPGLLFIDNANEFNVYGDARGGPLIATNPCGEQMLYPNESCNLGSINVAKFVKKIPNTDRYSFIWKDYIDIIRKTTRFLDNIMDVNLYSLDAISKASLETRRIGLGVMGVSDLLYLLQIPYTSEEGLEIMSKLAETLSYYSIEESIEIAKDRGSFSLFDKTKYTDGFLPIAGVYKNVEKNYDWLELEVKVKDGIRNVLTTTVAPTGSISMIADCSSGIEPVFALVYDKHVAVGSFTYVNKILENVLLGDMPIKEIKENGGSIQKLENIPDGIKKVFVVAGDITWKEHIKVQACWQMWIANAISKTINMPSDVTVHDVRGAYDLAHKSGLKGITVYRDQSRHKQVLNTQEICECGGNITKHDGCSTCQSCGMSSCSIA